MLKKASYIIVVMTLLVLVAHFFFGWMITNVDTWLFDAFAQFLRTGKYVHPIPQLGYKGVRTGTPPLYSLLLAILYSFPRADILLHILQIMMLLTVLILLFKILRRFISQTWAVIISCLFALIPGNIVFISYVMSDLGAQFLFAFYGYLIYRYLVAKEVKYLSASVLVGFISGLWRYSFVIFGFLSLALFMVKHPKGIKNYVLPMAGISVILAWLIIQHALTGTWGIADDVGIRYNLQMMWRAGVLPREDHPSVVELRKYIPKEVDLRQAYWDLEKYILPRVDYDYAKTSKLIGNVGKAAMLAHPFAYLKVTLDSFFRSHIDPPYQANLATYGLDYSIDDPPLYCGKVATIDICNPIVKTRYSYPIWNSYINLANFFLQCCLPTLFLFDLFSCPLVGCVFL